MLCPCNSSIARIVSAAASEKERAVNRFSNFLKAVSDKIRPLVSAIFWLARHEQLIRFLIEFFGGWPWGS